MTTLELYFWLVLPGVRGTSIGVFVTVAIACAIAAMVYGIGEAEDVDRGSEYRNLSPEKRQDLLVNRRRKKRLFIGCTAAATLLVVLVSFIPDRNTMYALVAWEIGQDVEGLSQLPADVVEYFRAFLEAQIGEIAQGEEAAEKVSEVAANLVEAAAETQEVVTEALPSSKE